MHGKAGMGRHRMGTDGRIGMSRGMMVREELGRDGMGRDGMRRDEMKRDELKRDGRQMLRTK